MHQPSQPVGLLNCLKIPDGLQAAGQGSREDELKLIVLYPQVEHNGIMTTKLPI